MEKTLSMLSLGEAKGDMSTARELIMSPIERPNMILE